MDLKPRGGENLRYGDTFGSEFQRRTLEDTLERVPPVRFDLFIHYIDVNAFIYFTGFTLNLSIQYFQPGHTRTHIWVLIHIY